MHRRLFNYAWPSGDGGRDGERPSRCGIVCRHEGDVVCVSAQNTRFAEAGFLPRPG